MMSSLKSLLLFSAGLASVAHAEQYDPAIVGTWTTKSKAVLTGPSFYDPIKDRLIEPSLTGISYSFTDDGHFEEAYYRAIANPTTPQCPSGIMQWQHGTYYFPGNGSIITQPFAVDGRQLTSSPCGYDESIYERYDQPELILRYEVLTDPYHGVPRLNLFRFDGAPFIPMYLAASPPEMLPTQTLNPTSTATPSATGKSRVKRNVDGGASQHTLHKPTILKPTEPYNADRWWWVGVGMTCLGTVMFMMPSNK